MEFFTGLVTRTTGIMDSHVKYYVTFCSTSTYGHHRGGVVSSLEVCGWHIIYALENKSPQVIMRMQQQL